jgi:hypothetical protein
MDKIKMQKKECETHVVIHLRNDNPNYCVEAQCKTHGSKWFCVTNDFSTAGEIMHAWPIVTGGMIQGREAYAVDSRCMIAMIPKKKNLGEKQ